MQNLVNLRHLDIRECCKLEEMPIEMSKLKNLQHLSDFLAITLPTSLQILHIMNCLSAISFPGDSHL
jgi:hypothetical protein